MLVLIERFGKPTTIVVARTEREARRDQFDHVVDSFAEADWERAERACEKRDNERREGGPNTVLL